MYACLASTDALKVRAGRRKAGFAQLTGLFDRYVYESAHLVLGNCFHAGRDPLDIVDKSAFAVSIHDRVASADVYRDLIVDQCLDSLVYRLIVVSCTFQQCEFFIAMADHGDFDLGETLAQPIHVITDQRYAPLQGINVPLVHKESLQKPEEITLDMGDIVTTPGMM